VRFWSRILPILTRQEGRKAEGLGVRDQGPGKRAQEQESIRTVRAKGCFISQEKAKNDQKCTKKSKK